MEVYSYCGCKIIGDYSAFRQVKNVCGMINIDVADIISTLSTETLNYVTVGVGDNITNAMVQSVESLPISPEQAKKMLFQILVPKDYIHDIPENLSIVDFIGKYNKDIDVCWGLAFDDSLVENIKVTLIASSK